jgi:hypothetical protein
MNKYAVKFLTFFCGLVDNVHTLNDAKVELVEDMAYALLIDIAENTRNTKAGNTNR